MIRKARNLTPRGFERSVSRGISGPESVESIALSLPLRWEQVMIPSNHLGLLIVCLDVTFLFLGAVSLGIRLRSRYLLRQRPGLNDYLALLAWV